VTIYLLLVDKGRSFFYSDRSEPPDDEEGVADPSGQAGSGLCGRLHDRLERFKSVWQHADSGPMLWARRTWDWLHKFSHPDHAMLARLRTARRIHLYHPASRSREEVEGLWRRYLNRRWWRHVFWLVVNAVIAPFSALLAILPGPNVIGYWFAYRAIHHLLIVWGIRRVHRGQVPIEWRPRVALDRPIERAAGGRVRHIVLDGQAEGLDEHVAWSGSEPADGAGPEGPATEGPAPGMAEARIDEPRDG
jgi:hypothetical protein